MNIYAIIPAYNSADTIGQVINETRKQLSEKNIIVVDDGSSDTTVEIGRQSGVRVLSHLTNRGKGAALKTGFSAALSAGADLVFTLDADGQHQPGAFGDFLQKIAQENSDVVLGNRMNNLTKMPFHRLLSNKITSGMISLRIGARVIDSQCGFRLIRAAVIKKIHLKLDRFDLESELILKAGLTGFRFSTVPIQTIYENQSSSIRHLRDTFRFVRLYFKSFLWY